MIYRCVIVGLLQPAQLGNRKNLSANTWPYKVAMGN